MKLIAAVDRNWGIGRNNDLLFYLPEDLKRFKELTLGKTVIMGFNTLLSLPKSAPLKDRRNIVLMRGGLLVEGAEVANSVEQLYELIGSDYEDAFVIGGAQIYELMEPRCNQAYITKIYAEGKPQVYFPNLDNIPEWKLVSESEPHYHDGIKFTYCLYERTIWLPNTFPKKEPIKLNSKQGAKRIAAHAEPERLSGRAQQGRITSSELFKQLNNGIAQSLAMEMEKAVLEAEEARIAAQKARSKTRAQSAKPKPASQSQAADGEKKPSPKKAAADGEKKPSPKKAAADGEKKPAAKKKNTTKKEQ